MYNTDDNSITDILRYMGVGSSCGDESLQTLAKTAADRVASVAVPRQVAASFALQNDHAASVVYGAIRVDSVDLARHLMGCEQVIAFAATLGCDVDRLIERDLRLQPSLALAEQAAATAAIERYADACCAQLSRDLPDGYHLTPRFSPGYGDCALSDQVSLLRVLDAYKRIGLTLTDSFMMAPMKSISGWLGVTTKPSACYSSGCAACSRLHCAFRKVETVE